MEYEGTFWCVIGQMGSLPGEQGRFVSALFLNSEEIASYEFKSPPGRMRILRSRS